MIKEMLEYAEKSNETITVAEAVKIVVGSLIEMSEHSPMFDSVKDKLTVKEYDYLMTSITCSLVGTIITSSKKNEEDILDFFKAMHISDSDLKELFKKKFNQA